MDSFGAPVHDKFNCEFSKHPMLSLFGFRMSAVVRNSGTGYFARNPLSKSEQTTSHALNSLSAASEPPRMSRLILEGHDQLQSFPLVYQ